MAVFVEAGRGRREWESRKSISRREGEPGKAVQAGKRRKRLRHDMTHSKKFGAFRA